MLQADSAISQERRGTDRKRGLMVMAEDLRPLSCTTASTGGYACDEGGGCTPASARPDVMRAIKGNGRLKRPRHWVGDWPAWLFGCLEG